MACSIIYFMANAARSRCETSSSYPPSWSHCTARAILSQRTCVTRSLGLRWTILSAIKRSPLTDTLCLGTIVLLLLNDDFQDSLALDPLWTLVLRHRLFEGNCWWSNHNVGELKLSSTQISHAINPEYRSMSDWGVFRFWCTYWNMQPKMIHSHNDCERQLWNSSNCWH